MDHDGTVCMVYTVSIRSKRVASPSERLSGLTFYLSMSDGWRCIRNIAQQTARYHKHIPRTKWALMGLFLFISLDHPTMLAAPIESYPNTFLLILPSSPNLSPVLQDSTHPGPGRLPSELASLAAHISSRRHVVVLAAFLRRGHPVIIIVPHHTRSVLPLNSRLDPEKKRETWSWRSRATCRSCYPPGCENSARLRDPTPDRHR